jgi:hypothetical protein
VAETALLPAVRAASHDAVVLADGFSCRTQLEQLGGVHSVHLAQLLAEHLDRPPAPGVPPAQDDVPLDGLLGGQPGEDQA